MTTTEDHQFAVMSRLSKKASSDDYVAFIVLVALVKVKLRLLAPSAGIAGVAKH